MSRYSLFSKDRHGRADFDVLLDRKEHEFPDITPSLTIRSLYELKNILEI